MNKITRTFLIFVGLSLFTVPEATAAKLYFESETIDNTVGSSNGFFQTKIKLDSNDKYHIAYHHKPSQTLKYATNASGSWVIETVLSGFGSNTGYSAGIAVDSNNNPHISGYTGGTHYATKSGGVWTVEQASGSAGYYTNVEIASNGDPYVSVYPGRYAYKSGGAWNTEVVYSPARSTSIALDGSDNPVLAYRNESQRLHVAIYNGSSWSLEDVGPLSGNVPRPEPVFNNAGDLYIMNTSSKILLYTKNGGVWSNEIVYNDFTRGEDLKFDSNNAPHVVFEDYGAGKIRYSSKASGSWVTEIVASVPYGTYPDMDLDSSDNPHFVFQNATTGSLMLAQANPGNLISGQTNNFDLEGGSGTSDGLSLSVYATADGRIRKEAYTDENSFLGDSLVGDIFSMMDLVVDDATLSGTHTITFNYTSILSDPDYIASGSAEEDLKVFHITGGSIVEELPILSRNLVNNTITVSTTSFSPFGIGINPEPSTLILLGSALFGWLRFKRKN